MALQTIAWGTMLLDSAERTGSFKTAVEQTFDGQHPCELCLQIAAAKRQEVKDQSGLQKDPQTAPQIVKAEKNAKATLLADHPLAARICSSIVPWPSTAKLSAPSRADQPPTPPPRALCA